MSKKSDVRINVASNIVCKKVLKWPEITFEREINWLAKFESSEFFPHLISCDRSKYEILMSYCGEPLTKNNCPDDWEEQAENILTELKKYKCRHNDIKEQEIVVKCGKMHLVDFGWATSEEEDIPCSWPINLGITYRISEHIFDDRFALFSSIKNILKA